MLNIQVMVEWLREEPYELELDCAPEDLELEDRGFRFTEPVKGKIVFRRVGQDDVMATGKMQTGAQADCVRCLADTHIPIQVAVDEVWMLEKKQPSPQDEQEDELSLVHTYVSDVIEPAEVLRELLMAEMPNRVYCTEDCKGLCAGCGANLNSEPCRCAPQGIEINPEPVKPDWKQALKKIRLD